MAFSPILCPSPLNSRNWTPSPQSRYSPDKSFGMQQRPDGDIEIDKKFWKQDFDIASCHQCSGVLKPDVVMFCDNVPKESVDSAEEASRNCDAHVVLGSALMTMSAFRLARLTHEANAPIASVNTMGLVS